MGVFNTKEFIEKAREVHGDKYDYSKVEYKNANTKVCIICPEHGEFWQKPSGHLMGKKCKKCSLQTIKRQTKSYTTEKLIKKLYEMFGNKYDYSKVEFLSLYEPIKLICPIHGEFEIKVSQILYENRECPHCKPTEKKRLDTEQFIEKAREVHGDKYDYSKLEYVNNKTKVCIICPEHGEFWQRPDNHLQGKKCLLCVDKLKHNNKKQTTEQFIEKAREVHGDKYDYSKVEYVDKSTEVLIICPEHGEFWQKPYSHLSGHGCPKCNYSHLERDIELFLEKNNIKFEKQKKFTWLKHINYLKNDFYLKDYNVVIECQGGQHFYPITRFGGIKEYNLISQRDKIKYELLQEHNIFVIYFTKKSYYKQNDFYKNKKIFTNKIKLLNFIKNGKNNTINS